MQVEGAQIDIEKKRKSKENTQEISQKSTRTYEMYILFIPNLQRGACS
jgi:hypothetical protein